MFVAVVCAEEVAPLVALADDALGVEAFLRGRPKRADARRRRALRRVVLRVVLRARASRGSVSVRRRSRGVDARSMGRRTFTLAIAHRAEHSSSSSAPTFMVSARLMSSMLSAMLLSSRLSAMLLSSMLLSSRLSARLMSSRLSSRLMSSRLSAMLLSSR